MPTAGSSAGTKQLRTVEKMWYRADHTTANAGCALIAGCPAGLLKARGVSAGAISSGKISGGDLVVAWANEWGRPLRAPKAVTGPVALVYCRPCRSALAPTTGGPVG